MKRMLALVAVAILSLVSVAKTAQATEYGYVCSVAYYAAPSSLGNFGYLALTTYSGPSCTGTYLAGHNICSTGGNPASCSSQLTLSELGLNTMFQNLRAAVKENQRVSAYTDSQNLLWLLIFQAN